MPRTHDIMAVHGVGEQLRTDTLSVVAESFYKSVRKAALEAGDDPNTAVKLVSRYDENRVEVHYENEIFRLWEISWERSFIVPHPRQVLAWLWQWASLYLNWAYSQWRGHDTRLSGRGPLPRTVLLLFFLLDLTLLVPLAATLNWMRAANGKVRHQKEHGDEIDAETLAGFHFATGLAFALSIPIISGLQMVARLGRAGAGLPLIGGLSAKIGMTIDNLVVGSLGDAMLYIFDSVQAAFIRGDLEKVIDKVLKDAKEDNNRDPLIHIIGHSLGSVIAYEVVSHSLSPEKRKSVKTLCTMGTVMDMIRYVLSSGGLVLSERERFGQDIPLEAQGKTYPHWLNLFARNDPATNFGPLIEFEENPTNQPVCSTPRGHSTYWDDVQSVFRPFLAWVARDNPLLNRAPEPPPPDCQYSILRDVTRITVKLSLFILLIAAGLIYGESRGIELLSTLYDVAATLLGWYARWLLGLGVAVLLWVIFLGVPTWLRMLWRRLQYRRLVPLDANASLNYWVEPLSWMGPEYVLALRKKRIWNLHDFMVAIVRDGQERISNLLDVPEEQVIEWARQTNLMRLHGIGFKESALLMRAHVESLADLSEQEPGDLIRNYPALRDYPIDQWIERAKKLKDVV